MSKVQPVKPLAAIVATIAWVMMILYIPSDQSILGTVSDNLGAGVPLGDYSVMWLIKAALIVIVFFGWLVFLRMYPSSSESIKLALTINLTILWLSLVFFFPFHAWESTGDNREGLTGLVAFFSLLGGLAIGVFWVRFLSDEIS